MTATDIQYLNTMSTMEKNRSDVDVNKAKAELLRAQSAVANKELRNMDADFASTIVKTIFTPIEAGSKLAGAVAKIK